MFATTRNTQDVNKDLENAANEGMPVADAVKESARNLRDTTRNAASALKDDLTSAAKHTKEHVRDLADNAQHQAADIGDAMAARIKRKPLQSSLLALGVGFVVGMIYKR